MGRVTHRDTQQMLAYLLSQRENVAKYWVTVTAGQTHTIQSLRVSAATIVDWGDGLSNEYTGSGKRTHVYASAGTYCVKIYTPENVLTFELTDSTSTPVFDSKYLISPMINLTSISLSQLYAASVFNSVDIKPLTKIMHLYLHTLSGATGLFTTSDFSAWNPTNMFYITGLSSMTFSVSAGSFTGFTKASNFYAYNTKLTTAQLDIILYDLYVATLTRTVTGGTIYIPGPSNAAPSGTFQACQSPPVSASTPGKEIAYELLNDSLDVGFNKWATVATN